MAKHPVVYFFDDVAPGETVKTAKAINSLFRLIDGQRQKIEGLEARLQRIEQKARPVVKLGR